MDRTEAWLAYITEEVATACAQRGLVHQIRRAWGVRAEPVAESTVGDYEWKLLEARDATAQTPQHVDGTYFVLRFEEDREVFVLQHDTVHAGVWGPHWEQCTQTLIRPHPMRFPEGWSRGEHRPAPGWLAAHLVELTAKHRPNRFSVT